MAHCHDIAAYSIQEEKRGKVYQEEDIFAQVMVEEDLFPEDDGYDVVLSNAVFISPTTKPLPTPPAHRRAAAAKKTTLSMGDGRDDQAEEQEQQEAFFDGSHPATTLGGGNVSTSCPQIPRLSLVPQQRSCVANYNSEHHCADASGAAVAGVDDHDDGGDDGEERGRKVKSPRGDSVDVLGMADDEQVHENHHHREAAPARRLPPGAVGYGQIVPTHFELRKTGGPHSKQLGGSVEKATAEKPEFMKVVLANRSAPTSPRSPTYEMDIGSSSSTALYKAKHGAPINADHTGGGSSDASLQATKKWPLGRRRAETDVSRGSTTGPSYESFPRPSLGSASSCTMSRAEQERRVRKESMEYIECPLPPMPEAEWWIAEGSGAPEQLYDDIVIDGDGDELAPSTPKPDGGSIHFDLGKGKHEHGGSKQLGSSKSAISYVDEERRRKKCVVQ